MKAQYHPNSTDTEEVEILDIFVDDDDQPKMMFVGSDGRVDTAPIGRFTELQNGSPPVKQRYQLRIIGRDNQSQRSSNHKDRP